MIKITIYKSFDGEKFDNREDCIDYEIETLKTAAKGQFIFFDSIFEEMEDEYDSTNLEDSYYILVKTQAAADYIEYLGELGSIAYPEGIGFWHWDDHIGKYRYITDDEVTRLERKLELIKKYR